MMPNQNMVNTASTSETQQVKDSSTAARYSSRLGQKNKLMIVTYHDLQYLIVINKLFIEGVYSGSVIIRLYICSFVKLKLPVRFTTLQTHFSF